VLDPIVLKRWADELEAALAAEEGDEPCHHAWVQ
jgi:hypothetical protein